MEQLKSGFKRTINWNKHQLIISTKAANRCLAYLIDPSFQGVNRLFGLSFRNIEKQILCTKHFLPTEEIKDCNIMIDGKIFLISPLKMKLEHMNTFERSQLAKELLTQLVVC